MCLRLIFVLASLEVMVTSLLIVMVGKLDLFYECVAKSYSYVIEDE